MEIGTKILFYLRYDYQAAAEDEISFDPDDLITHIEMVGVPFSRCYLSHYQTFLFRFHRLTRVGGVACAKTSTACSQPITCNC